MSWQGAPGGFQHAESPLVQTDVPQWDAKFRQGTVCAPYAIVGQGLRAVGGRQWQGKLCSPVLPSTVGLSPGGTVLQSLPVPSWVCELGAGASLGVPEAVLALTSAFLWCPSHCPRGLLPSPLS